MASKARCWSHNLVCEGLMALLACLQGLDIWMCSRGDLDVLVPRRWDGLLLRRVSDGLAGLVVRGLGGVVCSLLGGLDYEHPRAF